MSYFLLISFSTLLLFRIYLRFSCMLFFRRRSCCGCPPVGCYSIIHCCCCSYTRLSCTLHHRRWATLHSVAGRGAGKGLCVLDKGHENQYCMSTTCGSAESAIRVGSADTSRGKNLHDHGLFTGVHKTTGPGGQPRGPGTFLPPPIIRFLQNI